MQLNTGKSDVLKSTESKNPRVNRVTQLIFEAREKCLANGADGLAYFGVCFKNGRYSGFALAIGDAQVRLRAQEIMLMMTLGFDLTAFAVVLEAYSSFIPVPTKEAGEAIFDMMKRGKIQTPSQRSDSQDALIGVRGDHTETQSLFTVVSASEFTWQTASLTGERPPIDFTLEVFDPATLALGIPKTGMLASEVRKLSRERIASVLDPELLADMIRFSELPPLEEPRA